MQLMSSPNNSSHHQELAAAQAGQLSDRKARLGTISLSAKHICFLLLINTDHRSTLLRLSAGLDLTMVSSQHQYSSARVTG